MQSIDIFITPPIYTFVQDSILNGWVADHDDPAVYLFGGMYKSRDTIRRSISEASNFFLVHSIPVSEMSQAKSQTEVPMEKLNTLTNQEPMVDDYHSHDKIESDSVFVYNDKLHLSGIKRTKFPGFKLGSNRTYYSDTSAAATIEVGNQPFIFYPGKASKLYIDVYNGTQYRTKEISLIQHPRLNGSYYFDPDLKNIANDAPLNNSTPFDVIVGFGVQDSSILELNKLYVSAHQNPFCISRVIKNNIACREDTIRIV